jgi:transposase
MPTPRRYELTDEQWKLIATIMPCKKPGGQWNDHRTTLNGMMWILKSGSTWRDLPERYGSWKSVYHRFQRWTDDGTIDKILDRLRLKLDKEGYIDWDVWCVDGSNVRGHIAAAGASEVSKKTGPTSPPTTPGFLDWGLFTRGMGHQDPPRDLWQRLAFGGGALAGPIA